MSRYQLRLTGQDWRKASPGDANACLIAQALRREQGGNWTVAGNQATEWARDGETVKRQLRLGSDAKSVMRWFDFLGIKTGSTVTLYGSVKQPGQQKRKSAPQGRPHVPLSMGQKSVIGVTTAAAVPVVTGMWWIDALVLGAGALGMGGTIAVRKGWIPAPHPRPARVKSARHELPSLRQLRTMQPALRQAALYGARAVPEPAVSAPEPVSVPAAPIAPPPPPRPSWPVPAPREVPGVSHASAIPDYVPEPVVREQARTEDRSRS